VLGLCVLSWFLNEGFVSRTTHEIDCIFNVSWLLIYVSAGGEVVRHRELGEADFSERQV
jgi:hypothetical protein